MIHPQSHLAKLFLGLAVAGLIGAGARTPALAAGPQGDSITINAQGLDLRTPAGAAVLRQRVVAAAHRLCEDHTASGTQDSEAFMSCLRDMTRGATPQMQALVDAARGQAHYVAVDPVR
jgi:UrcA family protein